MAKVIFIVIFSLFFFATFSPQLLSFVNFILSPFGYIFNGVKEISVFIIDFFTIIFADYYLSLVFGIVVVGFIFSLIIGRFRNE